MRSAESGYIALPVDDVAELTRMAPRPVTSDGDTSGTWRLSDIGQLPVSFSNDVELNELTSASTTIPVSEPPHLVGHGQSCQCPLLEPASLSSPSPPVFQVGNSSCTASATSHVKRRIE